MLLIEVVSRFSLPPKLPEKNYVITPSLGDVQNWRAKTYLANNGGKKGKLEPVGYTAIHTKSNTLIPISRGDEHQQGYELLYHFSEKKIIGNVNDWITLFFGNNYIYDPVKERETYLNVIKKWIAWGGNGDTSLTSPGYNGAPKWTCTLEEFVEHNGSPPSSLLGTKKIKAHGARFIALLERLAIALRNEKQTHRLDRKFFDMALDAFKMIDAGPESPYFSLAYPTHRNHWEAFKNFPKVASEKIMKSMSNEDTRTVEELIFSHDGLKNLVHMGLKHYLDNYKEEKSGSSLDSVESFFGDIASAIEELDRVGGI